MHRSARLCTSTVQCHSLLYPCHCVTTAKLMCRDYIKYDIVRYMHDIVSHLRSVSARRMLHANTCNDACNVCIAVHDCTFTQAMWSLRCTVWEICHCSCIMPVTRSDLCMHSVSEHHSLVWRFRPVRVVMPTCSMWCSEHMKACPCLTWARS